MAKSNMKKYERVCPVCHKTFHYCSHGCSEYAHLPKYMDTYDSYNCLTLYNICAGFVNNWLPKEDEANRLKDVDLSYFDSLDDWMKESINEMKKLWEVKEVKEDNKGKDKRATTEAKETKKEEVVADEPVSPMQTDEDDITKSTNNKDYSKNRYRTKNK